MNPEKLFIDLDEEIIFIVQKIKELSSDKVILVVPEKASVMGSAVSLKLLSQEVAKIDKNVVFVSSDKVGKKLSEKAGLIMVEKPNEITEEIWEKAETAKEGIINKKKLIRDQLVKERNITSSKKEGGSQELKEEQENQKKDEKIFENKKEEDEIDKKIKHLLEPKIVEVDGVEIAAGGDILKLKINIEKVTPAGDIAVEKGLETGVNENLGTKKTFLGRDLTPFQSSKYRDKPVNKKDELIADKPKGKVILAGRGEVKKENKLIDNVKKFFKQGGNRNKFILGGFVAVVVLFILVYFVLPTATVSVTQKTQELNIEKQIVADTSVNVIDVENLVIPAQMIETESDISDGADTTGEQKTGNTATGSVTIFNKTASSVTIPMNTVLTSIESGLKYKLNTQVTIKATLPEDAPLISNEDVGVTAETFGEEYNLLDGKRNEFRIEGFNREDVYGKNFTDVAGGTTETTKGVSQEDYDNLKNDLINKVKVTALESLKNKAGADRVVLDNTFQFNIIKEEAYPTVGSKATRFDMSLKINAKVLAFQNSDLEEFTAGLVEQEQQQDITVKEYNYETTVISTEENRINLDLKITGGAVSNIDDSVKEMIKGKSLASAKSTLEGLEGVESVTIKISPSWIPAFVQHIPSNVNKIKIKIQE